MRAMDQIRRLLLRAILLAAVITTPHMRAQPMLDGRNLIFYFDLSTMSKDDQTRAVSAAEMLIQRNAKAEDRLAVMMFDGTNEVAVTQDFTYDPTRVLEAVRHIVDHPAGSVNTDRLASMTAATNIAEPVPGRKALFYFAGRIGPAPSQAELKPLRDRAANSRVAVYAIDTGETPAR
jgi:hypothetical protein